MKVVITNLKKVPSEIKQWYKIGEVYDVEPYRYNPEIYWEIKGWDGDTSESNLGHNFWIKQENAEIYDEFQSELDELFDNV